MEHLIFIALVICLIIFFIARNAYIYLIKHKKQKEINIIVRIYIIKNTES